jgi:hypothetical protein
MVRAPLLADAPQRFGGCVNLRPGHASDFDQLDGLAKFLAGAAPLVDAGQDCALAIRCFANSMAL